MYIITQLKDLGNLSIEIEKYVKTGDLASASADILSNSLDKLSAAQILAKTSTMNLTEAQKLEVIQKYASNAADYSNAESIRAISSAQKGTAASTAGLSTAFKGLAISIKKTTASAWTFLTTTPVGWMILAASAVAGLAVVYEALTTSLEEQKEKLEESKDAYKTVTNELSELNSELESTKEKIKELEQLPSPTWVEQEELERLREVTKELELQKQLKQDAQLKAAEELYKENKTTYEREFGGAYGRSVSGVEEALKNGEVGTAQLDLENNVTNMVAALHWLEDEKSKLTDLGQIAEYDTYIEEITDRIKESGTDYLSSISQYKSDILEIANIRDLTADEQEYYDLLSSMQKMIYEYYSPATWNNLQMDSIFDTSNIEKNDIIAFAKISELSVESLKKEFPSLYNTVSESELFFDEGSSAAEAFCNEINALSSSVEDFADVKTPTLSSLTDTISQLDSQLRPAFDTLKSAYQDIFVTDSDGNPSFTLENVDISMISDLKSIVDELNELEDVSLDYASFERLSETLTNTDSTADDVRNAINEFATEIIGSLDPALSECAGENYRFIQSMLESIGITNSEQLMVSSLGYTYADYIAAKEEAEQEGKDFTSMTQEEIDSLVYEENGLVKCGKALANFELKKILVNNAKIETADEVNRILSLANAAGIASDSLAQLAKFKNDLDSTDDVKTRQNIVRTINEYTKQLQAEITNFGTTVEVDYAPKQTTKSSSSGNSKDTWLEEYKSKLSILKAERDSAKISEQQYFDESNALYKQYLQNREKYAEESASAEKELHEAWNDVYEAERKVIDDKYSSGQMNMKDYYTAVAILAQKYYVARDAAETYGSYLEELKELQQEVMEGMKDTFDAAISGILSIIQDEINRIGDESDKVTDKIQKNIDSIDNKISEYEEQKSQIQDQIDVLEKQVDAINAVAEARKRQLDLEQSLAALNKAENQKNQMVFRDGAWVYDTDSQAIAEARESVTQAREEIQKAELETKIDSLKEQIDTIDKIIDELEKQQDAYSKMIEQSEKSYDVRIEALEAYMKQWEELSKKAEKQETLDLIHSLGLTEGDILAGSQAVFSSVASSYDTLLSSLKTGNYDLVTQLGTLNTIDTTGAVTSISSLGDAISGLSSTAEPEILNYIGLWENAVGTVSGLIGVSDKPSDSSDSATSADSKKGEKQDTNSLIGAVQTGGEAVGQALNETWLPAFDEFGEALSVKMQSLVDSITSMAGSIVESCNQAANAVNSLGNVPPSTTTFSGSRFVPYSGNSYASGTNGLLSSEQKDSLVGELGSEMVVDTQKGEYKVYSEPTLVDLPQKSIVLNPEHTKKILKGAAFANGSDPLSFLHRDLTDFLPKVPLSTPMENCSVSQRGGDTTVTIGDIHVDGVDHTEALVDEIHRKLPLAMMRRFSSTLK